MCSDIEFKPVPCAKKNLILGKNGYLVKGIFIDEMLSELGKSATKLADSIKVTIDIIDSFPKEVEIIKKPSHPFQKFIGTSNRKHK